MSFEDININSAPAPPPSGGGGLPPDLFDQTTILSLLSTLAIVFAAYALSLRVLPQTASTLSLARPTVRFLFIWHAADALCHFILEGSFLYLCFFAARPVAELRPGPSWPTPHNFLGRGAGHSRDYMYGPQAGGDNPLAQLWMVYARADRRWAGADLGVISLELLTVFLCGPLAAYICCCFASQDGRVYIWMIILATAELYGGFMTFCPEWLTGNVNLDGSNFMYLYVYLAFFNLLWVFIPLYAMWVSVREISTALGQSRQQKEKTR